MTIRDLSPDDPATIGRYRLLGVLGSGGMGRVLLGVGPDGRFVAIKQVHAHLLEDWEYRARFQREVQASTRVSGAFTAPVIDFDVQAEPPWLASVFIVGVPLDHTVAEFGPLPVAELRTLAIGLASAVREIHRCGLIHRDLKPANVILSADGPRVIDFGIAAMSEQQGGLTQTGSVMGSPAYMSPEQALSEPITPASDVFALGAMLAMAATGASPFAGASMAYTLFNIVHTTPDLTAVPPELRDMIAACLHKDPHQRPTPDQLLAYLGSLPDRARPWSESLHAEIDRQAAQLAVLTADPHATQAISGRRRNAPTPSPTGPAMAGDTAPRSRFRRTGLRAALAVAVVAILAAGITWFQLRDNTADSATVTRGPAALAEIDACAWLRAVLPEQIPAESGLAPDPATWAWKYSETWGCYVKSNGASLEIQPGHSVRYLTPTGTTASGFPVLEYKSGVENSCERGVDLSGANQLWGLEVSTRAGCAFTTQLLERLLATRDSAPKSADAASLSRIAPCDLLGRAVFEALAGPVPSDPAAVDAHACSWSGSRTMTVQFRLWDPNHLVRDHIRKLADGTEVSEDRAGSGSSCSLTYSYRTVEDRDEMIVAKVEGGPNQADTHCTAAESLLQSVRSVLPEPN
ncbi:serine/threonine-protein kinase [Nocardia huaxiensis]|uniref:serine/threonine-protein kinase n=1 Tax=Nocardia huaxiensis TaxID=2755382 RepID=UPI001E537E9D|nr:serine/threonine-protein kinase [Nocardia huaxiensis]UFS95443.1 serine/threonine protein kinase [Nocardia huaxiensis]